MTSLEEVPVGSHQIWGVRKYYPAQMLSAAIEKSARLMAKPTGNNDHARMLTTAPLLLAVMIDNYTTSLSARHQR